jgi:hypothetical protein
MNSIEKNECLQHLGTSDGVTMEDYFNYMNALTNIDKDTIKSEFKKFYPDETNWSF